MELHVESAITLTISAMLLAGVLLFGIATHGVAQESSDMGCWASVATRSVGLQVGEELGASVGRTLKGCETRDRTHFTQEDSEEEIRDMLVDDAAWCYTSFGAAQGRTLLSDDNVLCHVCALYMRTGGGNLSGVPEALQEGFGGVIELEGSIRQAPEGTARAEALPGTVYALDEPLAVIFVQERFTDPSRSVIGKLVSGVGFTGEASADAAQMMRLLFVGDLLFTGVVAVAGVGTGGVGAAVLIGAKTALTVGIRHFVAAPITAATGAFIGQFSSPDSDIFSGIVISSYTEDELKSYGCTTGTVR